MAYEKMNLRIIFLFVFIILLASSLYGYSLTKIEVAQPNMRSAVVGEEIIVLGEISAVNRGVLPVNIDRIDYVMTLEGEDIELARGSIEGGTLHPNKPTLLSFSIKPNFRSAPALILDMVLTGNTIGVLDAEIRIKEMGMIEFGIPFSARIDLNEQLQELAREKSKAVMDQLGGLLGI
jgi:hypothetical protein